MTKWTTQRWIEDTKERVEQAKVELDQARIIEDEAIKHRENMVNKVDILEKLLAEIEQKTVKEEV